MKYPEVRNYVAGNFVKGEHDYLDVYDPSDGSVISRVPLSSRDDVDRAVQVAQAAFPAWRSSLKRTGKSTAKRKRKS
jgi:malonate-semialdehyde dehydrogenase (acetylating)/methylmalonate-semialdehyde dehydrogenase